MEGRWKYSVALTCNKGDGKEYKGTYTPRKDSKAYTDKVSAYRFRRDGVIWLIGTRWEEDDTNYTWLVQLEKP